MPEYRPYWTLLLVMIALILILIAVNGFKTGWL